MPDNSDSMIRNEVRQMSDTELNRTPLHDLHVKLGAKMVPFAGYEMPVQFRDGIIKEHLQARESAVLFDVSHMGQVVIRSLSGLAESAARALETLMPADIVGLRAGRQRYGLLTDEAGGIIDDLIVARNREHLFLVVNASRKSRDVEVLRKELEGSCTVELLEDRALIAVQGPKSSEVLDHVIPGITGMSFMESHEFEFAGSPVMVSRSGYTGEDGFELSVAADDSVRLAECLLENDGLAPAGLGSRDSLRLEAGLCLHGNDIDETTSPVEAALEWAIPRIRRTGGERAGGFPGEARIFSELDKEPDRRRVGLRPTGRAPMRQGTPLFTDSAGRVSIGAVTSGGFGPTVGGPVSMGYVKSESSSAGTIVFGEVRGRFLPAEVCRMPFVRHRYRRRG